MSTLEHLPQETPPEPAMTPRKWLQFGGGFLGWYLVNSLIWLLVYLGFGGNFGYGFPNLLILPLNGIVLLVLALIRKTRWVALGILAALAVNFIISLALALEMNAICFMPFFIGD